MAVFLQIILINLVVSCDNIGVIALATRDLPTDTALTVRRIGIGLSLVLKILFIGLIGTLLDIEWLHIRIIGGIMLLYVTFQMLKQREEHAQTLGKKGSEKISMYSAVLAIIAADISMSLDNVVALLGIVSADGQNLGTEEYLMVIGSMLLCMPLLLWFSGVVTRVMDRFPVVTYACAGYLVYTAIIIIAEDPSFALFLETAHYTFIKPFAILCGTFMALYGAMENRINLSPKAQRGTLLLYITVIISSIMMVGGLSYLDAVPAEMGSSFQQMVLEKVKSGANAVYLLGMASEVLCFCTALLASMGIQYNKHRFLRNIHGMLIFIFLYLTVGTVGLSYTFGIGDFHLFRWLTNVILVTLLLLTYPAVFTIFAVFVQSRTQRVILALIYMFAESVITAVCTLGNGLLPFAGFLPKYYLSAFVLIPVTPITGLRIVLISLFYIGMSYMLIQKPTASLCKKTH